MAGSVVLNRFIWIGEIVFAIKELKPLKSPSIKAYRWKKQFYVSVFIKMKQIEFHMLISQL